MCKKKDKEIMNLTTIIADFEKNTEHMNYELRIFNERCTDLEDRLYREKKLTFPEFYFGTEAKVDFPSACI